MFGKRLAELRNQKELSQYELADRLNLSRTQLANYEQGKREPDFETLVLLADFFEVSLDYLLGRTDQLQTSDKGFKNVAFFNGNREELSEEEAEILRENLVTLRRIRVKL